jgi:nucleotide-binding universal stress UspA family protein
MKTIVVGYDGSDPAKRALERASSLAEKLGSKLVVTSVAEPVAVADDPYVPGDAIGLAAPAIVPVPDRAEASRELQEARELLKGRTHDAEYVATVGDAAQGIIEVADKHDADLIVVGTREPGFIDRVLGGDVSEAVSRRSHRDVLIVRAAATDRPGRGG